MQKSLRWRQGRFQFVLLNYLKQMFHGLRTRDCCKAPSPTITGCTSFSHLYFLFFTCDPVICHVFSPNGKDGLLPFFFHSWLHKQPFFHVFSPTKSQVWRCSNLNSLKEKWRTRQTAWLSPPATHATLKLLLGTSYTAAEASDQML